MSTRTLNVDARLYDYILRTWLREPAPLAALREETAGIPGGGMQIAPEQGQLLSFLVELTGARRAIEIGTFTGYSSLSIARALPPDGRLICCDVREDWTGVARRYWQEAGLAERIELRLAPAAETLDALLAQGQAGSFDFAFIDADKGNYRVYFERCLDLLRPGGLMAVDNVLWDGAVANSLDQSDDTRAIRALNDLMGRDERITVALVPIGDGLTLARKR